MTGKKVPVKMGKSVNRDQLSVPPSFARIYLFQAVGFLPGKWKWGGGRGPPRGGRPQMGRDCHSVGGTEGRLLSVPVLSRSAVSDSATPWTTARQAPLSVGILQAKILEWVAKPSSRGSSQPGDQTQVSHIAGGFFTI